MCTLDIVTACLSDSFFCRIANCLRSLQSIIVHTLYGTSRALLNNIMSIYLNAGRRISYTHQLTATNITMASPLAIDTASLITTVDVPSHRVSGPRTPWSPTRVTRRRGCDQKRMKVTKKSTSTTKSHPPLLDIDHTELSKPDDDDEGRRIDTTNFRRFLAVQQF